MDRLQTDSKEHVAVEGWRHFADVWADVFLPEGGDDGADA